MKGKQLTLFKAADGQYVTWNVAVDPDIGHIVPVESVIEVTKASILQGFRLVIQDYVLVAENIDEELTLDEELIFFGEVLVCGSVHQEGYDKQERG